jgi:hypothetical protein
LGSIEATLGGVETALDGNGGGFGGAEVCFGVTECGLGGVQASFGECEAILRDANLLRARGGECDPERGGGRRRRRRRMERGGGVWRRGRDGGGEGLPQIAHAPFSRVDAREAVQGHPQVLWVNSRAYSR